MKIFKTANYKKAQHEIDMGRYETEGMLGKKEKGCRECGNLAVGYNGLCQKCQEEDERRKERYKD